MHKLTNGLILFYWDRPETVGVKGLQVAYNYFPQLEDLGGSLRVFPNQTEALHTLVKIGNIKALGGIKGWRLLRDYHRAAVRRAIARALNF